MSSEEVARISGLAYEIAKQSGLSRRALAKRMGNTSTSTLQRLLDQGEAHNVTLDTLVRFAHACGYKLELSFQKKNQSS